MKSFQAIGIALLGAAILTTSSNSTVAATISFSGSLKEVETAIPGSTYFGVPIETIFTGTMNDDPVGGSISDGATDVSFGCCIDAGGIGISNDVELTADDADYLNGLAGAMLFKAGDFIDGVDIEGDTVTAADGRMEIGLSYILAGDAFADDAPGNYPFDPADLKLTLFFIVEEDESGADIYSAIGLVSPVPVPAALWLFAPAVCAVVGAAARRNRAQIVRSS